MISSCIGCHCRCRLLISMLSSSRMALLYLRMLRRSFALRRTFSGLPYKLDMMERVLDDARNSMWIHTTLSDSTAFKPTQCCPVQCCTVLYCTVLYFTLSPNDAVTQYD